MCTLIALHRCAPGAHLVVAANRDEYLARPAEGPALWAMPGGERILAPRDREAGGTWLGLNRAGVFAAVTNRSTRERDARLRSRGHVVLDALAAASALEAARRLAELSPRAYNPFNLFVADATRAFAIVYEEKPRLHSLTAGVHVIGNGDPDSRAQPKLAHLFSSVEGLPRTPRETLLEGLAGLCRTHAEASDPLAGVCVHAGDYGTHSSTLLWLGGTGDRLLHAEGAPCRSPYQDLTPLLDRLGRATGGEPGESNARAPR